VYGEDGYRERARRKQQASANAKADHSQLQMRRPRGVAFVPTHPEVIVLTECNDNQV
jgi:hypothetical protein